MYVCISPFDQLKISPPPLNGLVKWVAVQRERVMNDLSNATLREHNSHSCKPIPRLAVCILLLVFFVGLSVSVFILVVVHNVFFFLSFILLFALVLSFLAWNKLNWRRKAAVFWCLRSFPDSDLAAATEGQLVKITGVLPNF